MNENIVERIMAVVDREGEELSLSEWGETLTSIRSQIQSRIDAAREDQQRETQCRMRR